MYNPSVHVDKADGVTPGKLQLMCSTRRSYDINQDSTLIFPRLGNRTTIKQYKHIQNRNLLWHNNILFMAFLIMKSQIGLNFDLYVYVSFQDYCVWSKLSQDKPFLSKSDVVYFCPFWRHMDQEYIPKDIKKYMKIQKLNSELWKKCNVLALRSTCHVMSLLYDYRKLLFPHISNWVRYTYYNTISIMPKADDWSLCHSQI